jgi:hypothetical protein
MHKAFRVLATELFANGNIQAASMNRAIGFVLHEAITTRTQVYEAYLKFIKLEGPSFEEKCENCSNMCEIIVEEPDDDSNDS